VSRGRNGSSPVPSTALRGRGELLLAESIRQHVAERTYPARGIDQQRSSAVLPQQLPASTARHDDLVPRIAARDCNEPATSRRMQRRHHATLGTQCDAVRCVLHVASHDYAAVVYKSGGTDRKLGVRGVRAPHDVLGGGAQCRPVHLRRSHDLTYGMPSAAGARTRPTRPATAKIVTM
jgi:hypothetical protein